MKNKKNRKTVDGYKTDTLTRMYMTAHFPGLVQALE